jgi:nicotinamide phosphoribosyltransferase
MNFINTNFFRQTLLADSYKMTHHKMFPEGTSHTYYYEESRGGHQFDETLFFGLQYFAKVLAGEIVTKEKIAYLEKFSSHHFGQDVFNKAGWEHILTKHKGRLPLSIKALPEGMLVPKHRVLFTVENTDPDCFWLPGYVETFLSQIWYPITIATLAYNIHKLILSFREATGVGTEGSEFQLHNFAYRGVSSAETAGIGGSAALLFSKGTDTTIAIPFTQEVYNTDEMLGFSVVATEHSPTTAHGKDHEQDFYEKMIDKFPTGILSVVVDSYDVFNALKNLLGKNLKEKILARDGVFVFRLDSGYPPEMVSIAVTILGGIFGYTTNAHGYNTLHPKIRVLQGDGVDYEMIQTILKTMKDHRWAADNIVFGMGGALLQKVNRDTHKFAYKCSAVCVDGEWRDVFKDPVTDPGKTSKKGRFAVVNEGGIIKTVPYCEAERLEAMGVLMELKPLNSDLLQEVFRDGRLTKEYTFQEIRTLANHLMQGV